MDPVYDIESVRKKCLDLLRKEGRTMTAAEISQALVVPMWAADAGLESARTARLATYTAGAGWTLASAEPAPEPDERQGGLL